MEIWVTGDWHLGHQMLIANGYRHEKYEEFIGNNILTSVRSGILVSLGDNSMSKGGKEHESEIVGSLKSRGVSCVCVIGNHDDSTAALISRGWSFACQAFSLKMYGKIWVFSHEPMMIIGEEVNVHGHLHDNEHRGAVRKDGKHVLISQEQLQYRPIPLSTINRLSVPCPKWEGGKFQ